VVAAGVVPKLNPPAVEEVAGAVEVVDGAAVVPKSEVAAGVVVVL